MENWINTEKVSNYRKNKYKDNIVQHKMSGTKELLHNAQT